MGKVLQAFSEPEELEFYSIEPDGEGWQKNPHRRNY